MFNQVRINVGLILIIFFNVHFGLASAEKAPAEVKLSIIISKLGSNFLTNESLKLQLCVDKVKEICFWNNNQIIQNLDETRKATEFEFPINNMELKLTIGFKLNQNTVAVNFRRKQFNLKEIDKIFTMEFHSYDLETIIKVSVTHKCVSGYHPPGQCNKFCYPQTGRSKCDDFGNTICEPGLFFDSISNQCHFNNCIRSLIKCHNSGHCVSRGSTFMCECLEGYIGQFCETVSLCFPNPCKNDADCDLLEDGKYYKCKCKRGFRGNLCDRGSRPATISSVVINASCTCPAPLLCRYSPDGQLEACTPRPYAGKTTKSLLRGAETFPLKQGSWRQLTMTTTIVAAVCCILFLSCIIASLYVYHQTRNYRSLYRFSPTGGPASASTQYTPYSPQLTTSSTFKPSLSLDQNSTYLAADSSFNIPATYLHHPGLHFTLDNPSSVHSNSYQSSTINPLYVQQQHSFPTAVAPGSVTCMSSLNDSPQLAGFLASPLSDSSRSVGFTAAAAMDDLHAPQLPPRPSPEVLLSLATQQHNPPPNP